MHTHKTTKKTPKWLTTQDTRSEIPRFRKNANDFLVIPFTRLQLQASVILLIGFFGLGEARQDELLDLGDGVERVWHALVVLDFSDNVGHLHALCEVDQVGLLDYGRIAVLDECEIG